MRAGSRPRSSACSTRTGPRSSSATTGAARCRSSPLTADWTLIRFHYGERGRRGNYSERELREWAARIAELRAEAAVFAYFNNDWEGFAVRNGLRLRRLLEG